MKKLFIHKSGRRTFMDNPDDICHVKFEVRNKKKEVDEIVSVIELKEMPNDEFSKLLEDPQKVDIKKYGVKEIKIK